MIEGIGRQYITGSMWRAYEKGERTFCGISISHSLQNNQKLPELLITPSTKGILYGIPSVAAVDDVNITRENIEDNFKAFNFNSVDDINSYEHLLKKGFNVISDELENIGQIFVDTKFEFGYVKDKNGIDKLIYIDEVGTPDSSRIWDAKKFANGEIVENSKEDFRQLLLNYFPDPDILLNKDRMAERSALAREHELPTNIFMDISKIYIAMAEKITGTKISISDDPKTEIIDILSKRYQLID
jgi:phosphoribosylaminoimidazole-succinocarboxamide synthase